MTISSQICLCVGVCIYTLLSKILISKYVLLMEGGEKKFWWLMFFLCWLKMIIIFVQLSKHAQLGMGIYAYVPFTSCWCPQWAACFSSVHRLTVCTLYSYSVCSLFAVYGSVSLFWPQCLFGEPLSYEGKAPAQCSNTWLGYNPASQPVMLAPFSIFRVGWWGQFLVESLTGV